MNSKTYKALERYRKTATAIRESGATVVSQSELIRTLGLKSNHLSAMTPEWRGYVGCVPYTDAVAHTYLEAAGALRAARRPMTIANLAIQLSCRYESVREYLLNHPELNAQIGVELRYDLLEKKYEAAAKTIAERKEAVTRKRLAFELHLPYKTVCNMLSARPWLSKRMHVVGRTYQRSSSRKKRHGCA